MKEPLQKDDALIADIQSTMENPEGFRLWWLGQSGFLVQWNGQHLLLDPYLSDSLTHKYAKTDKQHIRMTARVVLPEALDFIDVVTSSHNHTDHLDAFTLKPLMRVNSNLSLVIPKANQEFVANRLDCDPDWLLTLTDKASVQIGDFVLTGVPAAHDMLHKNAQGHHHCMGYIVQFGPWSIYHSGDTLYYHGMADRLRPWSVDVALLPINGADPARRVEGNMNGVETAKLAKDINAGIVIPCHFDMFLFNTASPRPFIEACERLEQTYQVLQNGEGWSSGVSGG